MITKHDLQEAIAECEGQRDPNANTCIKLAAFYIIQQHMFPEQAQATSALAIPSTREAAGDSEFLQLAYGIPEERAWEIMDELMSTINVINPKLYNSIIRKLKAVG